MSKLIRSAIFDAIQYSDAIFHDTDFEILAEEIYQAIKPHLGTPDLQCVVNMRVAQKSYFRRKNEDTLSRAKKLEKEVDLYLNNALLPTQRSMDLGDVSY